MTIPENRIAWCINELEKRAERDVDDLEMRLLFVLRSIDNTDGSLVQR